MKPKPINWRLAATTAIVGASLFAAVAAWAGDTTVRVDSRRINDDIGTEHEVHDPVVLGADGEVCGVVIDPDNNSSIWDNNDFIVRSGSSEVVAFDIERAPDVPDTHGTLTLDGPATFWVRLGSRTFSAGVTVTFQCTTVTTTTTVPETTTTTSPPGTSTTVTTTIPPSTTTTTQPDATTTTDPQTTTTLSPPPTGGVDTGGGACADGACEGSAFPWAVVVFGVAGISTLGLALIGGRYARQ
jgi:hypothetical protein